MAIAKAERLMNLALCLMNTRRPLSKKELRESIEAYREAWQNSSEDAFNRMFERDKDDLRELGLVIDVDENALDGELGYLARPDRNRLPEIALDAEEAAALTLAARVWQQAKMSGAASGALQKLRAAGVPFTEAEGRSALEPRIPAREAAFEPLLTAARDRRPVTFEYRKAGAAAVEQRSVEPWALECWRGHWYLAGWDRDRGAARVFRLSRITAKVRARSGAFLAPVPEHVDVRATVAKFAGEGATATATVRVRRGAGFPLRTKALETRRVDEGWDELEIPYGNGLGADLAEFGPDVVVLGPEELRADVVDRLRAVAGLGVEIIAARSEAPAGTAASAGTAAGSASGTTASTVAEGAQA